MENHFISVAPLLQEVLGWAEEQDMSTITSEKFVAAVGSRLTYGQVVILNAAIWGFLAAAVSGSAETLFNRALRFNGLDA